MLRFKALMNRRAAMMARRVGLHRTASLRQRQQREAEREQQVTVGGQAYSLRLLKEEFDRFDSDGSGEIDARELQLAMEALGEVTFG